MEELLSAESDVGRFDRTAGGGKTSGQFLERIELRENPLPQFFSAAGAAPLPLTFPRPGWLRNALPPAPCCSLRLPEGDGFSDGILCGKRGQGPHASGTICDRGRMREPAAGWPRPRAMRARTRGWPHGQRAQGYGRRARPPSTARPRWRSPRARAPPASPRRAWRSSRRIRGSGAWR